MTYQGATPSEASELCSKRFCMVDGCTADMSTESNYCRHKRVCLAHQRANCVQHAGDKLWRFCQQCGKLEPLAAFDAAKRSCRASLARRRAHQRGGADKKAAAEAAAAASAAVSEPLAAVSEPLAGLEYIPIMNMMPPATPAGALPEPQAAPAGPMDDAAGAASAADMTFVTTPGVYGAQLDQQLQVYQQKCALLRMQIQLLEQQHHHSQQHTGIGAGELSSAGLAGTLQSPTAPTSGYNATLGSGQGAGGLGAASGTAATAGMPRMQSASSTASMWAPPGTGCNSLQLPQHMSASNSSSLTNMGLVSPAAAASMDAAAAAAHNLQQQQQLWQLRQQHQQAMQFNMGPAGQAAGTAAAAGAAGMGMAACMSPAGLTPTCPELDSSLCFSGGDWAWQQQMMQPPAHVQQMLPAAAYAGASAPLPAGWAPSTGPMPVLKTEPAAASCNGIHSGVLVPVLPHMFEGAGLKAAGTVPAAASGGAPARAAAAAAGEARCADVFHPLMLLGEEDGLDLMDCDSAEDIADMLEMSLLEAGMKAQMGCAAGMC